MRQKILEIVLTSLLSALIAILQAYLAAHGGGDIPAANPLTAATVGGALSMWTRVRAALA